jgi:hypothetical protein
MSGSTGLPHESLVKPINAADTALRRMREGDGRKDGTIKKAAFLPRRNGKDREGLSVSIFDTEFLQMHLEKFEEPGKAIAAIPVIRIEELGLTVHADPDPDDPRHALIRGIPDITIEENLAEVERIAELLAKRATLFKFPSSEESP